MNAPKTNMKQTFSKDIDLRRQAEAANGPPGRKVGEEMRVEVTPDRVRVRAYEIFVARNGEPGSTELDWLQAERELNGQSGAESKSDEPVDEAAAPEIKTRTEAQRQAAKSPRGGL